MTPTEFVEKWKSVDLKERTAAQSRFIDLCHLLGVGDPVTADPKGEWVTFEKGATKTSGGEGWADVWRKNCFAWEYKGKNKDLEKAFSQLQQYAIALENPPVLVVSDIDRIRLHTNTVQRATDLSDFGINGAFRRKTRANSLNRLRISVERRWLDTVGDDRCKSWRKLKLLPLRRASSCGGLQSLINQLWNAF
jgi:hypothetical protein